MRRTPRTRPSGEPGGEIALCVLLALGVLAFYLWRYPVGGFRLGLGSDTPVYIWWARQAGAEGLSVLGSRGRPGVVGVLLSLASTTGVTVDAVAMVFGGVLAAALGLAAGALVDLSLGSDRVRFVLASALPAVFVVNLVPGYFSTLAFGTLFVGALAVLALSIRADRGRWGHTAAGVALLGAGGLAHPMFLLLGGAVLLGPVVALIPAWRRDGRAGVPWTDRGISRIAASAVGAVALTGAGLLAPAGAAVAPSDTSRDALLRRLGLDDAVVRSYGRKLISDFPWYRAVASVGLAVVGFLPGRSRAPRSPSSGQAGPTDAGRLFVGATVAWLAVTVLGLTALAIGLAVPSQRLAAFCLPIPLLAAIGLRRLPTAAGGDRARLGASLMVAGAVLFVAAFWPAWASQTPLVTPAAVAQSRVAGQALARTAPGTPLIVVADPRTDKPGLLVARYANHVRAGVPGGRVPDVHLFVGTVEDLLAGRPTLTGQTEHDALSVDSWRVVTPLLSQRPLVVAMRAFDRAAYDAVAAFPEVQAAPDRYALGPGVTVLPEPTGPAVFRALAPSDPALTEAGSGPLSPWTPVWLGPLLLALLAVVGAPWAWLGLPSAGLRVRVALAPACGLAAVALAAVALDSTGVRLAGWGGAVPTAAAFGAGVTALALRRRRLDPIDRPEPVAGPAEGERASLRRAGRPAGP